MDAALTTEPAASKAVNSGAAVKLADSTEVYNNQQLAVLFPKKRGLHQAAGQCPVLANAYVRPPTTTVEATAEGLGPAKARRSRRDHREQHRDVYGFDQQTVPVLVDPDAALTIESARTRLRVLCQARASTQGTTDVDFGSLVNTSFAEKAAKSFSEGK